ncbi:MAG: hypothetical protein IPJ65_05480 [Archangiaceae bacterium]|nr:hypothetical protein [Archangiaceae bacterium]
MENSVAARCRSGVVAGARGKAARRVEQPLELAERLAELERLDVPGHALREALELGGDGGLLERFGDVDGVARHCGLLVHQRSLVGLDRLDVVLLELLGERVGAAEVFWAGRRRSARAAPAAGSSVADAAGAVHRGAPLTGTNTRVPPGGSLSVIFKMPCVFAWKNLLFGWAVPSA